MTGGALLQCEEPREHRLSVPRRGHVLSTVTEQYGSPIRSAILVLTQALEKLGYSSPSPSSKVFSPLAVHRSDEELAARHICSQWILAVALRAVGSDSDIAAALSWFDSENAYLNCLSDLAPKVIAKAQGFLQSVAEPDALADLLPYLLDPHGPGSRLSVIRDPSTQSARASRRVHGVFYTPADVAEHMAKSVLSGTKLPHKALRVLDPACGTGVFLRAMLCTLQDEHLDPLYIVQNCLFGMDIDPWSVDGAAYVLVHDAIAISAEVRCEAAPLWKAIRKNLAVADALTIDPDGLQSRPRLFDLPDDISRFSISEVFPGLGGAPNVIIGNPPYAAVGNRRDLGELSKCFSTFPYKGSSATDMHPLFFEQMVRLSGANVACSMVIPLSVAFSRGQQFHAMRLLIEETPGTWKFSFFDREPHALFGEDVKTRNTIVTWTKKSFDRKSRRMTGPLMKWRGHNRAKMLRELHYTEVQCSVEHGIPKLSSELQADCLDRLIAQGSTLSDLVVSFQSTCLEHTFEGERRTLFVGGTAYNFLNVFFRPPSVLQPKVALMSTNTMHALGCATLKDAFAAFAILSSGIAFWLWHILGDGFHLSKGFLEDFPVGPNLFNAETFEQLSLAGKRLWHNVQSHSVSSLNRGRASLSFPASRLREEQRAIDQIIVGAARLPQAFIVELDNFINSVVSALPTQQLEADAAEEVLAV